MGDTIYTPTGNFGDEVTFTEQPGLFTPGTGDTGSFDPAATSGTFLGMTGKDWAGGLKELGGAAKGAGGALPSAGQRTPLQNSAQAHAAFGQAGTLGQLLQILAQRANMFQQAAHQGAVPTPYRPGGGLLGL